MKNIPFSEEKIRAIANEFGTPFHIYDEKAMRENARSFLKAFNWNKGFKEFFALKALPNPFILKILKEEGFGVDCSSYTELLLADKVGMKGEQIMFTSNNTPLKEYRLAKELGAIINFDDISHIEFVDKNLGLPETACLRYNPGSLKKGNAIIGHPEEAKYGLTRQQMLEAYKMLKEKGVKHFGIHTMVASNELNPQYFVETAQLIFDLIVEIKRELDIDIEFSNLGGGIGIPYRPEEKPVDMYEVSKGVKKAYENTISANNLRDLRIFFESGRAITGPYGYLVGTVIHKKDTYKQYVGIDASMVDLMRPGMYGAYHHLTVLGKDNQPKDNQYDVTGSLCENNDKFAIDRNLPEVAIGDIIVIHDTGAHGYAMGFNYNGKLKSKELLLRTDG
ncbi:MAG: diaminopimelate decarboxylase, partial [Draconibacterium sp.]